jgi:hypothetical protein
MGQTDTALEQSRAKSGKWFSIRERGTLGRWQSLGEER